MAQETKILIPLHNAKHKLLKLNRRMGRQHGMRANLDAPINGRKITLYGPVVFARQDRDGQFGTCSNRTSNGTTG
ncbi:hypothetical protein [Bifidobacterium pseudolongum]|uniref:hypothetical protein n=1 Tax=Bifidobacterium pseudolongum TaxID=1694 RepID=UPI001020ABD0|nr:hypothetical protein [Bifidobacterium pseudolongum]MEE0971387.1 hypothetical protein [Bifidobacterium ruminantium]